jgi:hypothetical protein
MSEQESYADYMRRKRLQAEQQSDAQRGPFKPLTVQCPHCGGLHYSQKDVNLCRSGM